MTFGEFRNTEQFLVADVISFVNTNGEELDIDNLDDAEEFELALLYYETCQYSDEKYITLKEAIEKYGEDNLSYYNNQPLNSVGWISKNPDGAVFGYTFNAEFVTR